MRRRLLTVASVLVSLLLAASFALAAVAVTNTSDASKDARQLAEQTRTLAQEAKRLAQQIQDERARNVRDNCEQVNERHDNTVATLDGLLARARKGASPQQRKQIQQSRASTLLLIDALAPRRDCEALVRQQVGPDGP
jgi:esterase/lipase